MPRPSKGAAKLTDREIAYFAGDMRAITEKGVRRFDSFENGQPVEVLDDHGKWASAIISHRGCAEIWEIEVERCRGTQVIRTTVEHSWPVTSPARRFGGRPPRFIQTGQLYQIAWSKSWKFLTINPTQKPGIDSIGALHGIVFGDGTKGKANRGTERPCSIALCNDPQGADSRQLAPLFQAAGYKPIPHDDMGQVCIYGLPKHWKTLPSIDESPEYLRGFVAGWFAADGHVDYRGGGLYTIASSRREHFVWLQEIAPKAGLAVSTNIIRLESDSTFGPCVWYSLSLSKETLDRDFFLMKEKLARFTEPKFAKYWKIIDVRNTGRVEPVYCVESAEERFCVLEGNILATTAHPL